MVCEQPEAARVSLKGQNFSHLNDPQEYANTEEFRKWVRTCAETDEIVFELYGLWKDPVQQELLLQVQTKIEQDFGPNTPASCLKIHCVCKEVGNLADAMTDDKTENWVFYTNALRHIPIQYNQYLILPLPLHLAKCLEEYLFDA